MSELQSRKSYRGFIIKLGFELIVIVAGILIALAIDAWNNDRNDRQLERIYLQRLIDDMDANLELANEVRQYHQNVVTKAREIYPLINGGAQVDGDPSMIVVRSYWASAFWRPRWIDGTHQELLSTGRYAVIRSAELRKALLEYYGWTLQDAAMLDLASTSFRDKIRSELSADLQISIRNNCEPRQENCDFEADSAEVARLVGWLRQNDELARDLNRVIVQSHRMDREYLSRVQEATDLLRGMIVAELAIDSG
jgi:hypothetical protein